MIQAMLLDLDGVLRLWDRQYDTHDEQATGVPADAIRRCAFAPELLSSAVTGKLSDGEWRARIVEHLGAAYPARDAAEAVRRWSDSPGRIDPAVLELLRRCRRAIKVVLISNATSRLPHDLEQLGIAGEFDAIINSSEVGVAKPGERIYRAALAAAGTPPGATLFVDDSPGHVEAARRLGILGQMYQGAEQLEQLLRANRVI